MRNISEIKELLFSLNDQLNGCLSEKDYIEIQEKINNCLSDSISVVYSKNSLSNKEFGLSITSKNDIVIYSKQVNRLL